MILFSLLLIGLVTLGVVAAAALLAGGAGLLVVFGDLIVCGLIIWGLVWLFRRRK